MTSGTQEGDAARAEVEYFSSFDGYGPELSPVSPITFEQTRRSAGFTEVERDAHGFVAVLRKVSVTRSAGQPVPYCLGQQRPAGAELVFEAVFDPRIDEHLVGAETDYSSTRSASVYFAGKVETDGRKAGLRLFRRSVVFSEVYDRDPTGRITTAVHFTADRFPRLELFGEGESPLELADRYLGSRQVALEARSKAEELRQRAKQSFGEKQYQSAIADLEAALKLVEGGDEGVGATTANVLCNLGTGWLYLRNYNRATFFAACGLELHSRQQSTRGVGVCTLTLALAFQHRNLAAQAAECHRQAARFFLKAGDSTNRQFALDQLHSIESWRSNNPA